MSSEHEAPARIDVADGVISVTWTRDAKRNAINTEMWEILEGAVSDLESEDELRVLVIRAEGRFFTAGTDITTMRANLGEGTDGVVRGSNIRREYRLDAKHDLFDRLETVEKPVVLAVHGPCFGAGIEMGASCDFRLAADSAVFALPEVPNLAVIPGSGGISRLVRLLGPQWTKWLVMAGETITAEQALAIGLVQAVYPAEEFDDAVTAFATKLVAMPREALGIAKIAIDTAAEVDRRTARELDRLAQTLLFQAPEFRAKVDGFVAK